MTIYKEIELRNLIINKDNDRHGGLESEEKAIEWLLLNKTQKMKDLINDIFQKEKIFEEPLVYLLEGEKYIVYDGNRRVTCLKLLSGFDTSRIQNPLQKMIESIGAKFSMNDKIMCRIEGDKSEINNILELRHAPTNSGAGQLKWDAHEKENFLDRTGKSKSINFAREINKILIEKNYLNKNDRIPLSNFNRLFSSKEIKRRCGFGIENDKILILNDENTAYEIMTRIAKDMINGKITLDDVWDKDKKSSYLDDLEREGLLPSARNRLERPKTIERMVSHENKEEKTIKKEMPPHKRDYLIPTDFSTPRSGPFSDKLCTLFYEMQNTLKFKDHLISIAIAFRTFLQIITEEYMKKNNIKIQGNLAQKIQDAFGHMQKNKDMPKDAADFIKKIHDDRAYFSINTLHKVVHNNIQISDSDLRSYLNNLDSYIREAIENVNKKSK